MNKTAWSNAGIILGRLNERLKTTCISLCPMNDACVRFYWPLTIAGEKFSQVHGEVLEDLAVLDPEVVASQIVSVWVNMIDTEMSRRQEAITAAFQEHVAQRNGE